MTSNVGLWCVSVIGAFVFSVALAGCGAKEAGFSGVYRMGGVRGSVKSGTYEMRRNDSAYSLFAGDVRVWSGEVGQVVPTAVYCRYMGDVGYVLFVEYTSGASHVGLSMIQMSQPPVTIFDSATRFGCVLVPVEGAAVQSVFCTEGDLYGTKEVTEYRWDGSRYAEVNTYESELAMPNFELNTQAD